LLEEREENRKHGLECNGVLMGRGVEVFAFEERGKKGRTGQRNKKHLTHLGQVSCKAFRAEKKNRNLKFAELIQERKRGGKGGG